MCDVLVFVFTHRVWLRLADDDVSELFVSPIRSLVNYSLPLKMEPRQNSETSVVSHPKPHTVGKPRNQEISFRSR